MDTSFSLIFRGGKALVTYLNTPFATPGPRVRDRKRRDHPIETSTVGWENVGAG